MPDTAPAAPAAGPIANDAAPPDAGFAGEPVSEADALRNDILEQEPDWSQLEHGTAGAADRDGDEGTDGVRGTEPVTDQTATELHEDYYAWGQFLGMSREEVASTPRATLEKVINTAYQRLTAGSRQPPQHQPAAPHPHPQQAQQALEQQIAEYIGQFEFKPEDAELVDDLTRGMVEHFNKRFAQQESIVARAYEQIQALSRINGQLMYHEGQRLQQQYRGQIENALDGLDEDLFGRGQDATDQQRQNRWKVMREIGRLDQETQAAGRRLPSIQERARYVYNALFAERVAQRQTNKAAEASRNKARRAPARPSRTQPKPAPVGDAAAISAAARWLRENPADDTADLAHLEATAA